MDVYDSEDDNEVVPQEIGQSSFDKNGKKYNYNIINDIRKLGCSQKSLIAAAYRTFLDLCEIRKFEEVTYHYISELDVIYLKVQKKKDDADLDIVVPVLSSKKVSFKEVEEIQNVFKCACITLAICDMNSLIMYYKITKH